MRDNMPSSFLPAYLYATAVPQSLAAEMEPDASLMHHCPYLDIQLCAREEEEKKKGEGVKK